jgi:prepilin-type N-terminal cleavage/methylation domain-containing protein/prepilin-type processing-associated H-X9-DG protein
LSKDAQFILTLWFSKIILNVMTYLLPAQDVGAETKRRFMNLKDGKAERKTAFTLIELLVVVAIVAILAAMLLPSLSRSKAQAQSVVCKNHLHEMGIAVEMYADDAKAYPYYVEYAPTLVHWPNELLPYYKLGWDSLSYHCPSYNGIITFTTTSSTGTFLFGSYGYNEAGTVAVGDEYAANPTNTFRLGLGVGEGGMYGGPAPQSHSAVVAPSEMFAIMDSALKSFDQETVKGLADVRTTGFLIAGPGFSGLDVATPRDYVTPYYQGQPTPIPLQHGKALNVLSCDGHVAAVPAADLSNLPKTARNWNVDCKPHEETWPGD